LTADDPTAGFSRLACRAGGADRPPATAAASGEFSGSPPGWAAATGALRRFAAEIITQNRIYYPKALSRRNSSLNLPGARACDQLAKRRLTQQRCRQAPRIGLIKGRTTAQAKSRRDSVCADPTRITEFVVDSLLSTFRCPQFVNENLLTKTGFPRRFRASVLLWIGCQRFPFYY
tara:strand:- start:27685 stop:28209 length:525 start_codon:yes stop_codon:yes gene_type:complete